MEINGETIVEKFRFLIARLEPLYGQGEAASIARILFEDGFHLRGLNSSQPFPDAELDHFEEYLQRLLRHEPVQYILGQADFFGLKFEVNPHVLIPRPETEELVQWVLESCRGEDIAGKRLLDVGSGSGCIPIALVKKLPTLKVVGVDISPESLDVARRNANRHRAEIEWHCSDFLDPRTWPSLGSFDFIVSNPPYIDPSERVLMPANVTHFEPHLAFFTTSNPLEFYHALARFALKNLSAAGKIFVECNEFRLEEAAAVFQKKGFSSVERRADIHGRSRMLQIIR